ncbi:MAG: hypothetical protein M0R46_01700 [Candidatus Muirbacterium halophilum]|nr:hypothetical protein [Candidatus Muirbacterium halophilum]MCK9474609.1 hypothetical protein [Candidatus Muirbacterium halophilum]
MKNYVVIQTADKFLSEKKYIFDFIFKENLGIEYNIELNEEKNYTLIFEDKKIIINDAFFSKFNDCDIYYQIDNIPQNICFFKYKGKKIPIIYGNDNLDFGDKEIFIGLDIISSIFFMLTRWEEFAVNKKDIHARFDENYSLSKKYEFCNIPVVDFYLDILFFYLKFPVIEKKYEKKSKLIFTHDIDYPYNTIKDIFPISSKNNRIDIIKNYIKKSYVTYEKLIKLGKKNNSNSIFFFMVNREAEFDLNNKYPKFNNKIKKYINKVLSSGHIVGLHTSYNTFLNIKKIKKEKFVLEKTIKREVLHSRQHYLRINVPFTLRMLNSAGIKYEYSMGFSKFPGFRCGTGKNFNFYDFIERKKLKIKIFPFYFMDTYLNGKLPELYDNTIKTDIIIIIHNNYNAKKEKVKLIKEVIRHFKKHKKRKLCLNF